MHQELYCYLSTITNEDNTSNILRYVTNLNEVYNDGTIELGILNFLAQSQEYEGYAGKSELLSLILNWQKSILFKMGIDLNEVDYYSIDKLDAIIEMVTSVENYEDKFSLLCILNSAEDNQFVIARLTEELTKRHTMTDYLELLGDVSTRTIDLILDYCQTTTDDIINTPMVDLERHAKLKNLIDEDPNGYNVIKEYILGGFELSLSLKNILAINKEELIELSVPELIRNIKAAFLISGSTVEDAGIDASVWANSTFNNRPDAIVEIMKINFGEI